MPVHAETGERVLPDHEMAVMEVFEPGQRPKSTIVIDIPGAEHLQQLTLLLCIDTPS